MFYSIYFHRNKINNKVYIGQTCRKPERRWNNGKNYVGSPHFYSAIQKYGWDNFEHIIFATELTQDEANLMEKRLIALYDTTNPAYGYNIVLGGRNAPKSEEQRRKMSEVKKGKPQSEGCRKAHLKPISQYTKSGDFVRHYQSIKEAAEITGICRAGIGRSANGGCSAGGFDWRFEQERDV